MADIKVKLDDELKLNSEVGSTPANVDVKDQRKCIVTGSDGIFKNGKHFKPGDVIYLDQKTADNFQAVGGVKYD